MEQQWRLQEPITLRTQQERIQAFGVITVLSADARMVDTRIAYGEPEIDDRGTILHDARDRHRLLVEIVRYWEHEKGWDCITVANPRDIQERDAEARNCSARQYVYAALERDHWRAAGAGCTVERCCVVQWLEMNKALKWSK